LFSSGIVRLRLAALFTGGKDSTYAIYLAQHMGHEVVRLVTIIPEVVDSYMFHYSNLSFTRLQAESMGVEQVIEYTKGVKEEELKDLRRALEKTLPYVDGVVAGAIASTYQKTRVERIAEELGLEVVAPLWGREPMALISEIVDAGFEFIITTVSAEGLGEEWLGRKIDKQAIKELKRLSEKYGIHPCGEGGEFDTFVTNCPLFKRRIEIRRGRKEWWGYSGVFTIEEAILV